jgi:hypothetical protein
LVVVDLVKQADLVQRVLVDFLLLEVPLIGQRVEVEELTGLLHKMQMEIMVVVVVDQRG